MFQAIKNPIPEPMGIIAAGVYLISMFLFIPILFFQWIQTELVYYITVNLTVLLMNQYFLLDHSFQIFD